MSDGIEPQDRARDPDPLLSETTVPASVVDELLAGAAARGLDTSALEASCGIGHRSHPRARLTLAKYLELVKATQLATQDEMLGYGVRAMPIGTYGAICEALTHCPVLGQAFDVLNAFYGIFAGRRPYARHGRRVALCPASALQRSSPVYAQSLLLSCYKTLCWLGDARLPVSEVGFAFAAHPARDLLGLLFDGRAVFAAAESYLTFGDDVFGLAVVRRSAEAEAFARGALAWLLTWAIRRRLDQHVRKLIVPRLATGVPSFSEVARHLAMAPPTLSRKLAAQGLSYRQIKDDLRRDTALALLEKTDRSLESIARSVGFVDLSSFSRAFRRWMGVSPGEHRRQHRP
jgi:AraC-like DNA-binding protein